MIDQEMFERIVALMHESVLDNTRWAGASALIDEALHVHGNCMMFGDMQSVNDIQIYFAGFYFHGQRHSELEREYCEIYCPIDERVPRIRQLADSRIVHISDLYNEEEKQNSPVYNELSIRMHAQNSINLRMDGPDGSSVCWGINNPLHGGDWSSGQLDLIRRLLPHVRQYMHILQALASAGSLGETLEELLDNTGAAIIQLDRRGRIVDLNGRARDLLRVGDGLFDVGGYLFARTSEDNVRLQNLLKEALPPYRAQGVSGMITVRREYALAPLVLHINPVGQQESDLRAWPVAAMMLVSDPAVRCRVNPSIAQTALGLTEKESRVAVMLAEGMSVREIATATCRKESTIRSHVKRMFVKHGLTRQAELVRLVLSLTSVP